MKTPTITETNALLGELRRIAPKRPLSYGESLQVARLQATKLRQLTNADKADFNLIWLINQRAVPVELVASHKLHGESGLTTNAVGGKLRVFVNAGEPRVRQRFSLLHEWKHVLDFDDADRLHSRLGSGDRKRQAQQIELICNEFAAYALMPTALVKRIWFQTQDISLAATLFNVSPEAMSTRLDRLGLTGDQTSTFRTYFRRTMLSQEPLIAA